MTSTPTRGTCFRIDGWHLLPEERAILFYFDCDVYGRFEEMVTLPDPDGQFHKLTDDKSAGIIDLLAIAMGVSSYKLAAARTIALPALSPAGRAMAEALYTDGLAEFYVRSELPYPSDVRFEGDLKQPTEKTAEKATGSALVAFGGGKDSYVARAILQTAGEGVELTSVVLNKAVRNAIQATAPAPVLFIDRRLDPKLYDIAPRAFGGHVPITAINMMVLVVTAMIKGHGSIVFANERSANEPTMELADGNVANHQYSKSSRFEELINAALAEAHPTPPAVYSILRPFSELWIGKAFSEIKDAFGRFTSCNRNFRLAGDATKRWCGVCAKCAFTSLILSPFITRDEATQIFGEVFLDREALQPLYSQLLGLDAHKPWDCVGTIDECRAALWGAAKEEFSDTLAVQSFLPQLIDEIGEDDLARSWARAMAADEGVPFSQTLSKAAKELVP